MNLQPVVKPFALTVKAVRSSYLARKYRLLNRLCREVSLQGEKIRKDWEAAIRFSTEPASQIVARFYGRIEQYNHVQEILSHLCTGKPVTVPSIIFFAEVEEALEDLTTKKSVKQPLKPNTTKPANAAQGVQ